MTSSTSTVHRHVRPTVCAALVAACAGLFTAEVSAQSPAPGGRGGLLPAREQPTISAGETRDEMLWKFDLDSNGRIDEGEAEAARARMRRDKIESLQHSGIDPLTGRPRGAGTPGTAAAMPPPGHGELVFPSRSAADGPRARSAAAADAKSAPQPPFTPPSGRVPVITGGIRAGAPAARPGYGATGPKQELNAGRPREPQLTPGQARVGGAMRPAAQPPQQPGGARDAAARR